MEIKPMGDGYPLDRPPWLEPELVTPLRPLLTNATADVCVVGGGISGLAVAYEFSRRGASVVLLERGALGCGGTVHTTAHLVTALDERYHELERMHDTATAALACESHGAAIDRIEAIVREERIDCGFMRVDGYLFAPATRLQPSVLLARELGASRRAGLSPELLTETPGLSQPLPCLRYAHQAQFQPLRYVRGLARAVVARRGRVHTGTRVVSIRGGRTVTVTTDENLTVTARRAVVATGEPIHIGTRLRQEVFRSYVLALPIEPGSLAPALYWDGYWDEDTPYHYGRLAASRGSGELDLLLVGGEDEEGESPAVDASAHFERLRGWAREHFGVESSPSHRWHGRILEPHDELAYIGASPDGEENVFVVSGDSGNGMTYAAIAGMMLPDLAEGKEHRWAAMYSPRRSASDRQNRRGLVREGV